MTSDPDLLRRWRQTAQSNTVNQQSFSSMVLGGVEIKGGNNTTSKQTSYTRSNRRKKSKGGRSGILTLIPESLRDKTYLDYYIQRLQYYQPDLWSEWSLPLLEINIAAFITLNKYTGLPDYLFSNEKLDTPIGISGWEDIEYYAEDIVLPDSISNYAGIYLPYHRFNAGSERNNVATTYTENYDGFALIPLWSQSEDWVRTQTSLVLAANISTGITGKGTESGLLNTTDNLYMGFCNDLSFDFLGGLPNTFFADTIVKTDAPLTTSQAVRWNKTFDMLAKTTVYYDHFGSVQPLLHYSEFVNNTGTGFNPQGDAIVRTRSSGTGLFYTISKEVAAESYVTYTEYITGTAQQPTIMGRGNGNRVYWKGDWLRYAADPAYSGYANRKLAEALVDFEW